MNDTAILVTTFLRDSILYRCIQSIRRYYPDIAIFVGDNGHPSKTKEEFCAKERCELIELPFGIGVTGARNQGISRISRQYPYIVLVEDDIKFTLETKLEVWHTVLEAHPDIGVVGGRLLHPSKGGQHYEADVWIRDKTFYIRKVPNPQWHQINGIRYCFYDIVLNFFVMRREVWWDCPWDEQFKVALEHADWFYELKQTGKWQVAYTPQVAAIHARPANIPEYDKYRWRRKAWTLFAQKWNVEWLDCDYNPRKFAFAELAQQEGGYP